MVDRELEGLSVKLKNARFGPLLSELWQLEEFFSFKGSLGSTKNLFKYFSKKIKKNCAMLDRSIPTRDALVHSIPISEVKDMKSNVLRALKAFLSGKKTWNLVCRLNFNNFQERKKLHRLRISFCNISTVGIKKN
jgi:hypothetical protein